MRAPLCSTARLQLSAISSTTRRSTVLRGAEIYRERFADADGRIRATFDIVWLSAWAPHASQPKPLKPGSATASLEEAVKRAKR